MSEQKAARKTPAANLRAKIPVLAKKLSETESSTRLGQLIRDTRETALQRSLARTRKGEITKKLLSDITDDALAGLHAAGATQFPEEAKHLVIAAVGGYGRAELAPHSDIDLVFLHRPYARQKIKPLLDYILYALWDTGFSIAQSVHSPASAIAFVKEDLSGNTSFLDARFLAGQKDVYADFHERYEKHRKSSVRDFIAAKLEEREERLSADLASRYHVEPDIKEGKGGLRDLQMLHWLARYAYGGGSVEEHVATGVFSEEEGQSFEKALGFLWSVRIQMHDLRGRADERLTFDVQPDVAERLGYRDTATMPAAERLMKHYFITAAEVGRLTGVISASLEEAEVKLPRPILPAFLNGGNARKQSLPVRLVRPDELGPAGAFCVRGTRLDFVDHEALEDRPIEMFRLFRIAGRAPACEIHPDALKAVASASRFLDKATVNDSEIARVFRATILDTENPESVLRDMAETGLLGSYLPAFGRLVGRMKYGLFRTYTLDEHVLKSVGVLLKIYHGELAREYPVSTEIVRKADSLIPFLVMVLVHETAEAVPHLKPERVKREIRNSVKPLIGDKASIDDIVWVVTNYRLMAATAARRNVMEAKVVQRFCNDVATRERLDLLLVLTVCRLSVLGVRSSDNWTRRDITVLYEAAATWFENGEEALDALLHKRRETLRNKTVRKLADWPLPEVERFFARVTPAFFEGVTEESAARFARIIRDVDQSSLPGTATVNSLGEGLLEVLVYSRDKPGLYAAIAGTIASVDGVVRASAAFPIRAVNKGPDMAANIFIFRGEEGGALETREHDAQLLDELSQRFERAVTGSLGLDLDLKPRIGDRRDVFDVVSEVTIDSETSEDCLIVETRGLDRPGLLYQLAAALSDIGVSIRSAYVATYGELAIDAFYIQDLPGYKITDKRRLEVIRRRLLSVLDN